MSLKKTTGSPRTPFGEKRGAAGEEHTLACWSGFESHRPPLISRGISTSGSRSDALRVAANFEEPIIGAEKFAK